MGALQEITRNCYIEMEPCCEGGYLQVVESHKGKHSLCNVSEIAVGFLMSVIVTHVYICSEVHAA